MNNTMTYEKFCKRVSVNLDGNHRCSLLCFNCFRQTKYTNHGLKVAGTDIYLKTLTSV